MSVTRVLKKYRAVLSKHQKIRVVELGILMLLGGILETCSVSLVLPFIDAVMNPGALMEKQYAKGICNMLNIHDSRIFLMLMAALLAAVYILKNMYLLFEYSIQYRFVYANMFQMQKRLLHDFINRPYEYFLKVNSGEMIRLLNNDIPAVYETLMVVLTLFTESIVSMMLIAVIFMIAPAVTVAVAFVLLALLITVNTIIKPALRNCGLKDQRALAGMNKWLLQSIQGIKEVKVMQSEVFFQERFDSYGSVHINSLRKSRILNLMPRFLIEGICMAAMFIVIGFLIYLGENLEKVIPVVSAVAAAAVRLLPSVNRISSAMASVSYNEPMLDKLIENLDSLDESGRDAGSGKSSSFCLNHDLCFRQVLYRYPDSEHTVLSGADMRIQKGESIGIAGASGAGKTTLTDIMLGLLKPQQGQVLADGKDISDDIQGWYRCAGYIPQTIFMLDGTIRENITFGMENVNGDADNTDARIIEALEEASLGEFLAGLPDGLDTEIGERGMRLSGGQRQRIGIARVLFRNPEVLFFDEATSALDHETEAAIMDSIYRLHRKKTMVIIAHRLSTLEKCDHVYRVENGKIVVQR